MDNHFLFCRAVGIRTRTGADLNRVSLPLDYGPLLFPAKLSVCEWQFGQRNRRFSFLLSSQLPLMWSTCSVSGRPCQTASILQSAQRCGIPVAIRLLLSCLGLGRGLPSGRTTRTCSGRRRLGEGCPRWCDCPKKCEVSIPKCFRRRLMWAWEPPVHFTPRWRRTSAMLRELAAASANISGVYLVGMPQG